MTLSATPTAGLRAVLFVLALVLAAPVAAQSGKIAGRVIDDTNESIPGANVFIVETSAGATTNLDGDYTILNVSPGSYTLRISYIGYTTQTIENVNVNIDQTTRIDVQLQSEDLGLGEVTVRAEQPVVQPDVSNSQANVTAAEIKALPAASVSSVVGLQAGVQGLNVRGSGSDEIAFQVNGLTLRDERNNSPYTNISLASVEAVQVQTGGFNAEYGNVRSGVVNVVTKEGPRDRYEADIIARYSPPTAKNFDGAPNDPDSYWIRPYIDPDVAYTGTDNGMWPLSVQDQYPEFEGWNEVSQRLLSDEDPSNDLTPEALQQAFLWQHRKVIDQGIPDYDVDLGFGGPVPGISRMLGDLRFYASYRREENAYLIPLNTDRYEEQTGHIKLTSNVGNGMKVSVEGRIGTEAGTAASRFGNPGIFRSASGIAGNLSRVSFINSRIFSTDYWAPTEVNSNQFGATFTHAVNQNSFYEIRFNRFASRYDTNPGPLRDTTVVQTFGGVGFDEAPFGFQPNPSTGVDGMRMGVGMSNARDTSRVVVYNARADYTSQLTQIFQVKTGVELNVTDSQVNYGSFDAFLQSSNFIASWNRSPIRGAAYAQSKLELNGMIANLGLRLDYSDAGGEWYEFDVFDQALAGGGSDPIAGLDTS
ncbi:MAG: TonB-dependent receptor, partial [Bacteroidota bacterium]